MSQAASFRAIPLIFTVLLAALSQSVLATNSDTAKESRWAEQVIEGLLDGDEIWLIDDSGHEFLGVLTEADATAKDAVILVHGIGVHPDWPDVIFPLREGLLESGVTSLSIQMPILANEADPREYLRLFAEVPGRFEAALDYLDDAGYKSVVIVAHSMGASMATYYLSQADNSAVKSLVTIGMGPGISGTENIGALKKVKLPVMDLYGSEDLEAVLGSVMQRATAGATNAERVYRQVVVPEAGHFFQGQEAALISHVVDWIESQAN